MILHASVYPNTESKSGNCRQLRSPSILFPRPSGSPGDSTADSPCARTRAQGFSTMGVPPHPFDLAFPLTIQLLGYLYLWKPPFKVNPCQSLHTDASSRPLSNSNIQNGHPQPRRHHISPSLALDRVSESQVSNLWTLHETLSYNSPTLKCCLFWIIHWPRCSINFDETQLYPMYC